MELGNLMFGNSRGPIEVPRELVNSQEWIDLMHNTLQVEDYHCTIDPYGNYYDYEDSCYKQRTNGLTPDEYGGCTLIKNNDIIFQLFPYWWGDCTCGAEKENERLCSEWKKELFTPYQWNVYMTISDWCKDSCPACQLNPENKGKEQEELLEKCNCGTVLKNIKLKKRKEKIKDKIMEYERREENESILHSSDCAYCRHNFIYHPGKEDEFWIDWYKYPFRDSYMNKNLSEDEIKAIFIDCTKEFNTK